MNTASNMQVINIEQFRNKQKKKERVYTRGECLLSMTEVTEKVGVSRATINRWVKDDKFPPKFKLGTRIFWFESEIDEWLLKQKDKGNAQ